MASNHVTNSNRPRLEAGHPIAAGGDPDGCGDAGIRKAGATNKIVIPQGPLAGFVPDWLRPHGVSRAVIDYVINHEDVLRRLAHESETTTARRQVVVTGFGKINNRTTERDLDAMAVDILKRSFPASVVNLRDDDDEILTFFGFRSGPCKPDATGARSAFVERTVALQLILRRGIEVRKNITDSGAADGKFPLYGLTLDGHNTFDWGAALGTAEAPGTTVRQTLDRADQDRSAELRRSAAPQVGDPGVADPAGSAAMLTAMQATIERLERESNAQRAEIDGFKRRRIEQGNTSHTIPPATHLPFQPGQAPPNSTPKPTTAPMDDAAALQLLNQVEIDPSDAVDVDVIPEIVVKYVALSTINAEWVWGLVCPTDVTDGFNMLPSTDGSTRLTKTTASTRKLGTIYELQTVTIKIIASVFTVHATMATKIQSQLPQATRAAYLYYDEQLAPTILHHNRVLNAWLQGLKSGINKSLKFSEGVASIIRREFKQRRHDHNDKQNPLEKLMSELKNMKRQMAKTGGSGGGTPGSGGVGGGIKPPTTATRTDQSTKVPCANYLAGRRCALLDATDGKCIFMHEDGKGGSQPDAITNRLGKRS